MVFKAQRASAQAPTYPPAGWQPEKELQGGPPRSVRLTWKHAMVLVIALSLLFLLFVGVVLPVAGRVYVLHSGAPATGTIVKLHETVTHGRHGPVRRYFLAVQYQTPAGRILKPTEVSLRTYRTAHLGEPIAIHFLKSHADQFMVDQDQNFQIGPATVIIIVELVLAIILARLLTTELKIVRNGRVLPGMIVSLRSTPRRSMVVYFEHQGAPYQVRVAQKKGVSIAGWEPGKAMTLLLENGTQGPPPSRPRVVPYPYSIFKCTERS
ncbi:MAG: hypothetical protein ACRD3T_12460 [Terriglobia bacterium]